MKKKMNEKEMEQTISEFKAFIADFTDILKEKNMEPSGQPDKDGYLKIKRIGVKDEFKQSLNFAKLFNMYRNNEGTDKRTIISDFLRATERVDNLTESIKDYSKIKPNLMVSCVSKSETESKHFKSAIFKPFLNHLSYALFIDFDFGVCQVQKNMVKDWNVTEDQIWQDAFESSKSIIDKNIDTHFEEKSKILFLRTKDGGKIPTNFAYLNEKFFNKEFVGDKLAVMPKRDLLVVTEASTENILRLFSGSQSSYDDKANFYPVSPVPFKIYDVGTCADIKMNFPEGVLGMMIVDPKTGRKLNVTNSNDEDSV